MANIATVIRRSPFNSRVPSEALRMSLGLTLGRNEVTVIFVEDGIYLLASPDAAAIGYTDVKRHIATLKEFHCQLVVERESLQERDVPGPDVDAIVKERQEIVRILEQSDRVIAF